MRRTRVEAATASRSTGHGPAPSAADAQPHPSDARLDGAGPERCRPSDHRRRGRPCDFGSRGGRPGRVRTRPTSRMRARASWTSTSSYRPGRKPRGNVTGPNRTRMSRLTVHPTASKSRRTSRLRPSRRTTWNHRFVPSPPAGRNVSNRASPSVRMTPRVSDTSASGLGSPRIRTAYSRSIPERGCMSRWASSPSSVSRSSPVVLKSNRPIAIHRARPSTGSRSNTVGLASGSWRAVTSPAGLW